MTEVNGREKPQTRRRKSLSDKQLAILEVIQRSIARHGYPPSMREIGDAVDLKSLSSVTHQLNQLELSGYLRRDAGKTRAMEVLIDLPGMSTENPADSAPSVGDAAICDGDWVVVRQQQTAENGDIVAAMLDDEATVKTFRQRDGHTWLLPRNSAFEPILGDDAEVLGTVVAVLRSV